MIYTSKTKMALKLCFAAHKEQTFKIVPLGSISQIIVHTVKAMLRLTVALRVYKVSYLDKLGVGRALPRVAVVVGLPTLEATLPLTLDFVIGVIYFLHFLVCEVL